MQALSKGGGWKKLHHQVDVQASRKFWIRSENARLMKAVRSQSFRIRKRPDHQKW